MNTKQCSKCHVIKNVTEFLKDRNGLHISQCRSCRNAYLKLYRKDNKESISEKAKNKRINNIEHFKEKGRLNRYKNKKQISEKGKIYNRKYTSYDKSTYLTVEECPRLADDGVSLEVKCKYCGSYFKPTNMQVTRRIQSIKGQQSGESSLYCTVNCKRSCGTYWKVRYTKEQSINTSREVQPELRKLVLERDDYKCKKCNKSKDQIPLHCHHIDPVVCNPIESADIDNCITLCKDCHRDVHNQDGCKYHELRK